MLDQPMPRNEEAELAVLGSILISPKCMNRVQPILTPRSFGIEENATIYKAICNLAEAGEPIELITVKDELRRTGAYDRVGGLSYLSSLLDSTPDVANVEKYAGLVKDAERGRDLVRTLGGALASIGKAPALDIAATVSEDLLELTMDRADASAPIRVSDLAKDLHQEILERKGRHEWLTGISTGIPSLDSYLLGYQRGVLTVAGGYTSVGKTAIGLDLSLKALTAPGNEALGILYVSLEMTNKMLGYRLLSNASGEKLFFVRTGNLSDSGLHRVEAGRRVLEDVGDRFFITDGAFGMAQIAATARALRQQGRLDLMFVDYLQLVEGDDDNNREREVNRIGQNLLRLAKQLDIAVVAFAQLNDGVVNREGHEPRIQDMRESRAINQHARTVILINRPWIYDKPADDPIIKPCLTNLHIEKNSESKTGVVQLHFDAQFARFEDGGCHPECEYYEPLDQGVASWPS